MEATERRALGRIPFEGLVEVGDGVNDGFEAQAMNVSLTGLHLRTAYLPDIGQTLTCRFEMPSGSITSEANVVWKHDADQGGEFGVQFTNLDADSEAALQRAFQAGPLPEGSKVRLHIEGLGSPMRARIRKEEKTRVTATSDLAFLKVGNALDLEDATSGNRRPAKVHDVQVEMDPESRVPKLVVSMRYADDVSEPVSTDHVGGSLAPSARSVSMNDSNDDEEVSDMRSPLAQAFSKVTPALLAGASRAKTSVQNFIQARMDARAEAKEGKDAAPQVRRTTSPPPNGGLHASGRKVVRDGVVPSKEEAISVLSKNKRTVAISAAVLCTLGLGYASFHKSEPKPEASEVASAALAAQAAASITAPAPQPAPVVVMPPQVLQPSSGAGASMSDDSAGPGSPGADGTDAEPLHGKVVPFGHGNVTGGKVIVVKMDGRVARIQGAMLPTGFTVVVPKRKSVTTASSLTKQDKRIQEVKVTNEGSGAEVSVSFKDGVPPYVVRAKGDSLEIVLGKTSEKDEMTKPELKRAGLHDRKKHGHKKKHHD
jgi:hypothetical protein